MKTKIKTLSLLIGVFQMAAYPLSSEAAISCGAGPCVAIDGATAQSKTPLRIVPKKPNMRNPSAPLIAQIDSKPGGKTYGHWAAQWAQWAIGSPAATNPIFDPDGQYCALRQVDDVWFLAGANSSDPVVRQCSIPAGKSLFFPLINNYYGAWLNDLPEETRTEEFVRAKASCSLPATISASIDGRKVLRPTQYFTGASGSESPIFNVQLPPGNIWSDDVSVIPELLNHPSAEQGYYLFIKPLPIGTHTIQWTASGCSPGQKQNVTYHITVEN